MPNFKSVSVVFAALLLVRASSSSAILVSYYSNYKHRRGDEVERNSFDYNTYNEQQ